VFNNFKAEMVRNGFTIVNIAPEMEMSEKSLQNKLAGKYEFKLREMSLGKAVIHRELEKQGKPTKEITLDYLFGEGA
jgi:nucleoside-triphosphatase THEP1